ncbi:MAG TPA: hypothetical protein VFC78_15400, partial [Tepidisphaeraceae bacterium]|nr:hypothetical protein [Tepidisphaeraceae bacterium]
SAALPGFSESIYGGQAASSKKMYGEKEHPLIEQLKREHEARGVPSAATVAAKTDRARAASEKYHDLKNARPDLHVAGETELSYADASEREKRLKAHGYALYAAKKDYESAMSELEEALQKRATSKNTY